ncbi:amidohydrolase [Yinghuangia sp. ASG 101]|uniref:amidohydrolase family protein n=1 Tax=Yinghuangia sp. ASG 101 TaxID=2896848 RepID=UPI001E55C692|nr:amidohydrolase family protein [Yinghuangia sp. ASG 101]UGQ12998.1 amidohydrolase [Yinghuangia sp. ASG 101]
MLPDGFRAFDADNHYYEALDAFTRHLEPAYRKRCMQWAQVDGKTRLLVGGKVNRFIPDPTFSRLARPGVLEKWFRGTAEGSLVEQFGALEPTRPAYRDRTARLEAMDELGLDGALFFPTLGVGMEQALIHDIPALCAAFRAFNRWLREDWGFAYRERIFAAPYLTLADPGNAVAELDWALDHDARLVVMQYGPIRTAHGWTSPGDPAFEPFWARAAEAGITIVFHGGDSAYTELISWWGEPEEMEAFRATPMRGLLSAEPIADTIAALLSYGVLARHPRLRIAAIETGADWIPTLFQRLRKSYGQQPHAWPEDPRETLRRQLWVSPFHENDLARLRQVIGVDRIMMGSDWPHTEGIAQPLNFAKDLAAAGYTAEERIQVMRTNAEALVTRLP